MDQDKLSELIEDPSFHQKLLKGYRGPYSLGVADDGILQLCVPESGYEFPTRIVINGETIRIEVLTGWKQPQPLGQPEYLRQAI